jgi:hypothetical protein
MTNPFPKPKTKEKPSKDPKKKKQTKCDDNLIIPRTNPYNETPEKYIKELGPVLVGSLGWMDC